MQTIKLLTIISIACTLLSSAAKADIFYMDMGGLVTVDGAPTAGVLVEAIPCDGARLPSDWPAPPPSTVSTLPDANGFNYRIIFISGFGDGSTPGPAGSFTFFAGNGAWFTAADVLLRFSYSNCEPVTVSCADVLAAYFAAPQSPFALPLAVINVDIDCPNFLPGDTATIGFWGNKNGQTLIKSFNGGQNSTVLGNWLAENYPALYGATAGSADNLTGKSNRDVASYYIKLLGKSSPKLQAQIMATALNVYVTDIDLGGTAGARYRFNISSLGTGVKSFNVGPYGSAIGLLNDTSYTVLELLAQANLRKQMGSFDIAAFNVIFGAINEAGQR